jgi:hypothetical protein
VPGRHRARILLRIRASLPIWSCSVWGLPCPVLYRTGGALLPHLFTLTGGLAVRAHALRASFPAQSEDKAGPAVCSLWHWPSTSLEARVPDVIRHTALRSSDFPPPAPRASETPAATARSSCQPLVYRESRPSRIETIANRDHRESRLSRIETIANRDYRESRSSRIEIIANQDHRESRLPRMNHPFPSSLPELVPGAAGRAVYPSRFPSRRMAL